jgi:hypothetical protein
VRSVRQRTALMEEGSVIGDGEAPYHRGEGAAERRRGAG